MRDPSIHITEKKLALVLEDLLDDNNYSKQDCIKLAKRITTIVKTDTLINRSVIITNDKLEQKAKKLLSSSRGDADLMANIIYNVRKKLKHRGIAPIKVNTRDWNSLKELTNLVIEFCNDFELGKREGFIAYVQLALGGMNSNRGLIPKMVNMYERICNEYESADLIQKDDNKQLTRKIHDLYIQQIIKKTGMDQDYLSDPRKYSYFILVKQSAQKFGVSPEVYMKAQFSGFEWMNGIPDPVQLIGDKAKERLNKYMYENGIKVHSTKNILSSDERVRKLKELKKKLGDGEDND